MSEQSHDDAVADESPRKDADLAADQDGDQDAGPASRPSGAADSDETSAEDEDQDAGPGSAPPA